MTAEVADKPAARTTRSGKELVYRHTLSVRLAHWINALCIILLVMSGLQIFNAHAMLHWGISGDENDPAVFSIYAEERLEGPPIGYTQIGPVTINTTGVLGVFTDTDGMLSERGFPWWATIPSYQSLAEGRRWHFFFVWLFLLNGLIYLVYGFAARHFQRDLAPTGKDIGGIGRSILDHLKFRHAKGEAAKRYNVLQKITYIGLIFIVLPLMLLTGISMSPGIDSAAPWLLDLFGGRQSARTIHFICMSLIVLFILVHIIEVIISGPINEMRSMITGWFAVRPEDSKGSKP
jgi:thiosulfate reductase cytochrome b subunit